MNASKAPAASGGLWAVKCWEYTTTHKSKEAAEKALREVEALGRCNLPHKVVQVDA